MMGAPTWPPIPPTFGAPRRSPGAPRQAPQPDIYKLGRREPGEIGLHGVDVGQVAADVVIAAVLARGQPEAAPRVGVAGAGAAEVDDGGEVTLLLERGGGDVLALECL